MTAHVMTAGLRESFPTGRRLALELTSISRGIAADKAASGALPTSGTVVALPQFALSHFDGKETINRIQWDGGSCVRVVAEDQASTIAWRVEDSTLPTQTGTIHITPDVLAGHKISGSFPDIVAGTEGVSTFGINADALQRSLTKISRKGSEALFELVRMLLPYTTAAVDSAARRIYREIHDLAAEDEARVIPVIDNVEAESVVDRLCYGDSGKDSSVLTRLLRRSASTDVTVCKSVAMYIAKAIWSSAETNVRSAIGDPHSGRVIRRLSRMISSTDPEVVLEAFRRAYPKESMGISRVQAALSADATIGAQGVTLDAVPVSW